MVLPSIEATDISLLRNSASATAKSSMALDRLTHHVHILEMNGESFRLKRSRENASSQASEEPDEE